jgi:uncharacterized protein YidB (DUF937 family)
MGLLDILNGMQNGPRGQTEPGKGGMSPLTMGLLALLAYKAYQKMSAPAQGGAPAPAGTGSATTAGGGLGDLLGGGGLGSLLQGGLGGLGGLLAGGAGGSMLNGGLSDLLQKLEQNGLGDATKSWVGTGENRAISPDDLGRALGSDTINTLSQQTNMSPGDLLSALAKQLPGAIDHITPQGRVPTEHEMSSML